MKKLIVLSILISFTINAVFAQTNPDLVIGEFKITKIIDGDTFRFEGLDTSTRLLGIDTEETFKDQDALQKTNEIAKIWEQFYATERGDSKFPVKTDSPMGYAAWKWAEEFFKDVEIVRLERENLKRDRDMYGRYLVYVIAIFPDGSEVNYNIECVRQGYSPYFDKYGRSERFHDEFVAAQNYARENKLGIWDAEKNKAYPDYEERLVWWNKRADQLQNYETYYRDNLLCFNLLEQSEYERLKGYLGEIVTVFGSISEIKKSKFPYLLRIPVTRNESFELVIFEEYQSLMDELDFEMLENYNIYAKGKLTEYKGKLQIILKSADQVWMD
ncbi:MAG: hypothetical protein UZ04_CHB001002175 [Chlorobi bacterium OLB4]|jgi:Micrococcal nuclease (thermonuclease) homologs|nr:MAG: hypothetical protein UZ04_CHB001002175 [Chlorobi bacterium OLB4]MBW7856505.1 thermonuclease family protein [Ignavibacteria bacterium]OQY77704.1 MAG: hypothetical protein B6D43_04140 [Ignavibacteriales bacterium UTCHB1]